MCERERVREKEREEEGTKKVATVEKERAVREHAEGLTNSLLGRANSRPRTRGKEEFDFYAREVLERCQDPDFSLSGNVGVTRSGSFGVETLKIRDSEEYIYRICILQGGLVGGVGGYRLADVFLGIDRPLFPTS